MSRLDDAALQAKYPAAYRRIHRWMEANAIRSVSPSELVTELGFITREEVIRRILDGADWAEESGGRYVYADPAGRAETQAKSAKMKASDENDPLRETVRNILKKESERNRIGVSATYLKRLTGNPPDSELNRILSDAPWAVRQYGFYRYADEEAPAEPVCEQLRIPGEPPREEVPTEEPPAKEPPTNPDPPQKAADPGSDGWQQLAMLIPDDEREEMRVGTVLKVKKRARYLEATVDFGPNLGKAQAKVPAPQDPGSLVGRQVVCGVKMTGGSREVLIKGVRQEPGLVAISPTETVRNGDRVE